MLRRFFQRFWGAVRRVIPGCMTDAQSIAYNMFLSFFPVLLFALGLVANYARLTQAVQEVIRDLRFILPPGTAPVVMEFVAAQTRHSGSLLLLGAFGTLVTGTQVVAGMLQAFRNVHRDPSVPRFWRDQARALALLLVCFAPLLAVVVTTVFAQPLRTWMIHHFGLPWFFEALWIVVYVGLALVSGVLLLSLLYRAGSRGAGWNSVLPGAGVATALWWVVNTAFGYYVRRVPYSLVYGGLATAIGLMIWMNLIAVVILLGAAYNAECRQSSPAA
jgi:membrane protein